MNGVGAHEGNRRDAGPHGHTGQPGAARRLKIVLWAYRDRMLDLKNDKRFRYVLIFKNHGEAAGASLEHPHSQLIALPIVPRRVREEVDNCWHYYDEKERCIFLRHYSPGARHRRTRHRRKRAFHFHRTVRFALPF